jgi:hypothetical protein
MIRLVVKPRVRDRVDRRGWLENQVRGADPRQHAGSAGRSRWRGLQKILLRLRDKNPCPIGRWGTFPESLYAFPV